MTSFLRRLFSQKSTRAAPPAEDPAAQAEPATAPASVQPPHEGAKAAAGTTAEPARCANCERVVQFDDTEREDSGVVEFLPASGSVTTFCPACAAIERQWRQTGIVTGDRQPLALKSARMLSPEEVREMFGGGDDASSSG